MLAESFNDALIEAVKACGGSKAVGIALWPSKGVEAGQRQLLACLNPDRNEKLGPDEVLLILRMARERGFHDALNFVCADLGYAEPQPIEPKDELADLLRQYLQRREQDSRKNERLESLLSKHLSVRAAA
jgi:hypothetical protein